MRIAIISNLSKKGSTLTGRILPLAQKLAKQHEVHILHLKERQQPESPKSKNDSLNYHIIGSEPFMRAPSGKKRLSGILLILNMLSSAIRGAWVLIRLKPDVIVLSKPLPAGTLSTSAARHFNSPRIILDVDDFELSANKLTSLASRAAIHWSQRHATKIADEIVTASPFLQDHFKQLSPEKHTPRLIPTGLDLPASFHLQQSIYNSPTIAYLGSISTTSGHNINLLPDILQNITKHNPKIKLIIAGSGDEDDNLKKILQEKHLLNSTVWHGRFTASDLDQLIDSNTIIVDPIDSNIVNRAKSSYRVALALACGLPVVTSDVGIRPQLIPSELHKRFFATPSDPDSYAEKITQLINHPISINESRSLISQSQKFSWNTLADQYQSILRA